MEEMAISMAGYVVAAVLCAAFLYAAVVLSMMVFKSLAIKARYWHRDHGRFTYAMAGMWAVTFVVLGVLATGYDWALGVIA